MGLKVTVAGTPSGAAGARAVICSPVATSVATKPNSPSSMGRPRRVFSSCRVTVSEPSRTSTGLWTQLVLWSLRPTVMVAWLSTTETDSPLTRTWNETRTVCPGCTLPSSQRRRLSSPSWARTALPSTRLPSAS